MAVETKYTYQNHHHKHQFVGGEELPALEAASQVKVSKGININYVLLSTSYNTLW